MSGRTFKSLFRVRRCLIIIVQHIPININLMELMGKIVKGYRPNKHDKNTVLLLDELVEKIYSIGSDADTLWVSNQDTCVKINNIDNDFFEISGV